MERIRAIYNSLSRQERKYLKSFLNAFHSKGSNKALTLLELFEKNPSISQHEASQLLYSNPKSKAFIMLKARLLEKMLETLVLGLNLQNNVQLSEDPGSYEVVRIIKQLSYALMLRKRGLEEIAKGIFEKCNQQAEEAGLPEFRLPTLIYLQNISVSRQNGTWEYAEEISKTLAQFQTDIIGIGIFDEFNLLTRNHSHFGKETSTWLKEKTSFLEKRLEDEYTVRTHYFYLNLLVSYYEGIQDYPNAREALEELIDLVSSSKGLRSKNRLGTPYLKLAAVECMAYHFEPALKAALKARALYHPRKYNYFSASLYSIFTNLYLGKLHEAREILNELSWFKNPKKRIKSIEITFYLESCLYYLWGEVEKSYQILSEIKLILADKQGWNTGIRIYEIMLLIDLDKLDLATARIESLRKHLAKYKGGNRQMEIFRSLYLLDKNAFDFHAKDHELQELFFKLKTSGPWRAISHEVIRFDAWIVSRKTATPIQEAFGKAFSEGKIEKMVMRPPTGSRSEIPLKVSNF